MPNQVVNANPSDSQV